ncbi:polysaccharide biosynthesis/export family protein [uncultured Polaribacter sp.]|uniref:polysaccharide biosynthesis/export family protein n=1 Tax=uncultured Polaribacter sp. TaxID=174711 RepID=UPI00260D0B7B|nr:polysaccharide biosynthesis/export family protein [uncultured Polaribacter sp.]
MNKYLPFLIIVVALSACVSSKELTYLQGNLVKKSEIRRINNVPYKLQIDDILNITITSKNEEIVAAFQKNSLGNGTNLNGAGGGQGSNPGYFSDYTIDNYGNIRVPTLGEINVLGYTALEVRKKIEAKLREEYINNDNSLFVSVKLSGIRYTVIGEIGTPGTNTIFQNRVSIIDAIANSGGITDVGDREHVEIIRTIGNSTEKHTLDLTNIDVLNAAVFYIQPNDIINIKPLREKSWGTGTTGLQSLSTIVSIFTLIASTVILARNL